MILEETYMLANGVEVPKLGLGTWLVDDAAVGAQVLQALEFGYRHIDTAQAYGNERGVGEAVRRSFMPRGQIFVTDKIAAEHKGYKEALASIDQSLETMGLDYIDLMLIHSPQPWDAWRGEERYVEENREVWRALEDAFRAGKLRAIGVSNFLEDDLESLMGGCVLRPMVNQILVHAGNTPTGLIDYCNSQGIQVEAYAPLGHGHVLEDPKLQKIAKGYHVSTAQLCIRYVLQLKAVALPKATSREHIALNASVDFEISAKDMKKLQSLDLDADYGEDAHFPVFSGKTQA